MRKLRYRIVPDNQSCLTADAPQSRKPFCSEETAQTAQKDYVKDDCANSALMVLMQLRKPR